MRIVAVSGSPRIKGNTGYLIDHALEEARRLGIETERINVTEYRVNPCLGHDGCGDFTACPQEDDAASLLNKLFSADGIILSSPVYFWNVSAQLKALMDRARFYRRHKQPLRARTAGLITLAQGGGIESTETVLLHFIRLTGKLPPEKVLRVNGIAGKLGEAPANTGLVEAARKLGRDMAQALLQDSRSA